MDAGLSRGKEEARGAVLVRRERIGAHGAVG